MGDLFEGVIGHRAVIGVLEGDVAEPAHAYLFVGPLGVGKAMVARRFAAGIICGADQQCQSRVMRGFHPDVAVVEPDGRSAITVEQARNTVALANLAPVEGARKIFILEEGGAMNDEAANALLKTLEEPTASTIFLVVAESEDDLPSTVASRCRTVVFGRVPETDIEIGLVAQGIDAVRAKQAAQISGGRPGLAVSLATRADVAAFRNVWMSVPLRLSEHPGDGYRLADEVEVAADPLMAALKDRQREEAATMEAEGGLSKAVEQRHARELKRAAIALHVSGLEILSGFYRDAAAAQLGAPVHNPDIPAPALTRLTPRRAVHNADRILEAIDAIRANQRPQLALASLFSDIGGR
ncbi:MAG: AAA family ATPase [Acidimicrobiia bacterium]|nr:AAA family ATPase [Acidimicrobiia bacterium]MDX2468138.1 AAA family ATPase [Acidimicrobiia bacterium]